ncbi:MAG TPA: O-antigen ligase family protein [Stellaceae bacterium]|nr:O-antigen ligase family protein [Stellaceae bacterium]
MMPAAASTRDAPRLVPEIPGAALALAALVAPPLAVFAPLGLAPLLALLALTLLAADRRGALAALRARAASAALLALLAAWGGATALWSPVPLHSLFEALRFLAIAAAGLLVMGAAQSLPERQAARVGHALLAGVILAILLLQLERHANQPIARAIAGLKPDQILWITRYDRGISVLLLMAWPAAAQLMARRRLLATALLALAVGATVFAYDSRTSILAFAFALPLAFIAWRLPRFVARSLFAGVLLMAFALPLLAPGGAGIERIHRALPALPSSAIHRLAIWRFTADAIAERPLFGWGMDAARAVPGGKTPVDRFFPEVTIAPFAEVLPLHPHDAALQWRLELGLPGTLLALALLGLALEGLAGLRVPPWRRALALGYATAALAMALLSFGAWQAWWLSTLWLGAAFLGRLGEEPGAEPG